MRILLEENSPGRWEVAIDPTSVPAGAGPPSPGDLGMVFLTMAKEMFSAALAEDETPPKPTGQIITLPPGARLADPPH